MAIEPLDGDDPRVLALCHEAAAIAHTTPELLEEIHLQAWAAIDPRTAAQQRERREAARERRRESVQRAQARLARQQPAGITAGELDTLLTEVKDAIDTRIGRRLAELVPRLEALEQRHTRAAPAKNRRGAADVIDAAILRLAPAIDGIVAARLDAETSQLVSRGGTYEEHDALCAAFDEATQAMYAQLRALLEHAAAGDGALDQAAGTAVEAVRRDLPCHEVG